MSIAAIILMGGCGSRMGNSLPKQFLPLGGKLVYEWVLHACEKSGLFRDIFIVVPTRYFSNKFIHGGDTRQQSSYRGIQACHPNTDFVVILDGVRPFVSQRILKQQVDVVQKYFAVTTSIASHDTINVVKNNKIALIPERSHYYRGQTPQSFSYPLIKEAHKRSMHSNAPDDASLVLSLGHPVYVVQGEEENFKITTQLDYFFARSLATFKKDNK